MHTKNRLQKGQLSKTRIAPPESQKDWTWDPIGGDWQKNFAALEEYVRENYDALVPQTHKTADGITLGQWVSTQRTNYKQGKLSKERIALLESQKDWAWKASASPTSSKS